MNEIALLIAIESTVVCVVCMELLIIVWMIIELQARHHYLKIQRKRLEQEILAHARLIHPVRRTTRSHAQSSVYRTKY